MPYLYPYVSNVTESFNSASYLNETDYNLFVSKIQGDFWYGTSDKDAIEFSVYDLNQNLLSWKSDFNVGEYKISFLTYYDDKNRPISYEYRQFVYDLPLYKTEKVLVNPVFDVSSSNLPSDNYILGYQFTRYLAGTPLDPLVIKDISPSKTEIKLIPSKENTHEYNAYCLGKVPLDDVSPFYIIFTKECPYDSIYQESIKGNENAIQLLKNIFFIPNDGKFVEFLKFLYEDYIKFSVSGESSNRRSDQILRTQGIKTYFSNFLVSHTNDIYSFDEIKLKFEESVLKRLDVLLVNFKSDQYNSVKKYLFDVFTKNYFYTIHNFLKTKYEEKFQGALKNAICYGRGNYIPIINSSYIDERINPTDPLTLLVKLQTPIKDDVSIKSLVWVANISMIPFLFNAVIQEGIITKTFKISPPDFTIVGQDVSLSNSDDYFNEEELQKNSLNTSNVDVSRKIKELNVDYSSFDNFIVFSSAGLRHNIFKNKMISVSGFDLSLSTLETNYSSSGYTYSYYTEEKESLQTQKNDIIDSFDGFESYLYKNGNYSYSTTTKTFYSQSFVDDMDSEAAIYDKNNRDSLVNNTPEYVVNNSDNDEYLIFLSMVGHYFDNLYLYIKTLPSQHPSENNTEFSRNILQNMLQSFGWKFDASFESLNIFDNYLDISLGGINEISADERTRQSWNRILNTLPLIYKTKGTEECVKLILACYGIPSTLINLREYGGVDYTNTGKTSYSIEEKIFMLTFKGYREYLSISFDPTLKTIEMKVSLDQNKDWKVLEKIPLAVKYNQYNEIDWTIGVYKEKEKYVGRAYFEMNYPSYDIGIIGDFGIVNSPNTQSFAVADSLTKMNPDFVITTGDNTYETGLNAYDNTTGRLYHQFMNPYIGVSGSGASLQRWFPTIGNHDWIGSSYNAYQTFHPNTPRFYTFKKGNVQFFMLNSDTNEPSGSSVTGSQGTWFKEQLTSSFNDVDILWRIAVFHHPYVTSTTTAHGSSSWMNWPFAQWGIDMCIAGHQHSYERLESGGIPFITQGIGGAALYTFTSVAATSKFQYTANHGYSVLTARGNKLTLSLYDMYGNLIPDTGTTTLPSSSIKNGSYIMEKTTVPFSDRPFRQSDKYILSDKISIFNGEVFNLMVRKNIPDEKFEYNPTDDLVPTLYDLWIQRKEDGRTIFSSLQSDVFTQTYNYKFSNAGTLYFGNYQNSSSFVGQLDKILIWDSPITDHSFNDHSNNINSYSYTGSHTPYQTLYFRMNYDYPEDFSVTNPFRIVNRNETYSSSIWMDAFNFGVQSYSGSIDNCISASHSVYPYQFKEISYNQTFTITSYGPNKFRNQKVQKTELELAARLDPNDRSTFLLNNFVSPDSNQVGLFADPNDYKNKDIFKYLGDFSLMSTVGDPSQMFDDKYYSLKNVRDVYNQSGNKKTYYNELFTLYKFYFDKSIFETIKQLIPSRNIILSGILVEPTVLERPKYQYKKMVSEAADLEYTSSTPSIITSSNNVWIPTLTVNDRIYAGGTINFDFISVDFRVDKDLYASQLWEQVPLYVPTGPYQENDPVYIEYNQRKNNLHYVDSGWIKKNPDVTELGVVEQHSNWPIPIADSNPFGYSNSGVYSEYVFSLPSMAPLPGYVFTGSGYYYLNKCYFYVKSNPKIQGMLDNLQKNLVSSVDFSFINDPTVVYRSIINSGIINDIENPEELGIHCDVSGKIVETLFSGSNPRYLIKNWSKQNIWNRTGEFCKPQTVESQSLYLYTTEIWDSLGYSNLIYTSSFKELYIGDPRKDENLTSYSPNLILSGYMLPGGRSVVENGVFTFDVGTFKGRPNVKTNNLYFKPVHAGGDFYYYITVLYDADQYYETVSGYSRNHLTHKRISFGKESVQKVNSMNLFGSNLYKFRTVELIYDRYIKSRQTIDTTIDQNGLEDNTPPIQTVNVSNINVIKTDNVLS